MLTSLFSCSDLLSDPGRGHRLLLRYSVCNVLLDAEVSYMSSFSNMYFISQLYSYDLQSISILTEAWKSLIPGINSAFVLVTHFLEPQTNGLCFFPHLYNRFLPLFQLGLLIRGFFHTWHIGSSFCAMAREKNQTNKIV